MSTIVLLTLCGGVVGSGDPLNLAIRLSLLLS